MFSILAQDVTGYPTLKFFKSGADSSVKHRGGRDIDSLVAFIDEQMGRAPAKKEVTTMCTDRLWYKLPSKISSFCGYG